MGAIVTVPNHLVAEAKAELYLRKWRFGKASEGNHPLQPQMTNLYFEEVHPHREATFNEVCVKLLNMKPEHVRFYDIRLRPSDNGGRGY